MSTKPNQFRSLIAASGQAPTTQTTGHAPGLDQAGRRRVGKRTAPDYVQVGIYLPRHLHTQAKVLLLQEGEDRDFSQLMGDLLAAYLLKQTTGSPRS